MAGRFQEALSEAVIGFPLGGAERLTPKQPEAFGERIGPTVRLLFLAREWMQQLHFAHDDRQYQAVCKAQDAMYALRIRLHYASAESANRQRSRRTRRLDADRTRQDTRLPEGDL